jgi:hypothetical protein
VTARVSDSVRTGPFRVRVSVPLGKGRVTVSAGRRTPFGWLGVQVPVGKRRRRRG